MATTWEVEQLPTDSLCATSSYASLHSLLSSGDFSDMTIRCRGREFKTHRAIVCSQSSFFKTALSSNFKEGASGIVDLPDDDPEIVQFFLEFLYTGTYSVDDSNQDTVLDASEATNKHILTRLECPPGSTDCAVTKSPRILVPKPGSRKVTPKQQTNASQFRWSPYAFKASPVPTENEKKTKRRRMMNKSIQIYVLADKYDVPALKLLARDRFFKVGKGFLAGATRWCSASWEETAFFSEIVKMIYDNTFSGQDPLRQALHMIIGMKTGDDVMKERMREEMMLNGEGAPSSTGNEYRDEEDGIDAFCATSIHASLSKLLHSEKFSDMTIRCGGREFKAHRAIICTQSSFFDRALSSNFKEAASRVVELPDDDPDVLERFLEFLYTGAYSDDVNHTWGKPSTAAMVSPEEVQENLNSTPGVPEDFLVGDERPSTPCPGLRNSNQVGPTGADSDENDLDYKPPSTTSTGSNSNSEPEEEYNEFYGDSPSNSEQEPEHSPEKPSLSARFVMKLSELDALDKEEAMQRLVKIRNDMVLLLRLYIMADKYDVPALRLLARDRFYRAVELEWEHAESFPDIVDELYLGTPQTDTAMREIVCRIVGSRILNDRVREKMRPVMEKHGGFAVGIMEYAIHSGRIR
ncbi:BTB domain-containing protein [Fusarium sp. Ph1]|nr:BTB domain-containing protein [Fusarium sp. Ph1]